MSIAANLLSLCVLFPLDDPQTADSDPSDANRVVAAYVNETPITAGQVARELHRSTGGRPIAPAARSAFTAAALEKLVNRELVLLHLADGPHAAEKTQVDQMLDRLQKLLAARDVAFAEHLKEIGLQDEQQWRREAAWQISWSSFREDLVTDANLAKFFARNRKHYDGTQVRVAHLLLRTNGRVTAEQQRRKASEIREQIQNQSLSFAAAAQKHSQSPTAEKGGEIGWIERRKPMPESFSKAAFDLEIGQVSEPVSTPFGVHLITVLEIKPGEGDWQAARKQLIEDVDRWLFQWAAEQGSKKGQVRYTGALPYWKVDASGDRTLEAATRPE